MFGLTKIIRKATGSYTTEITETKIKKRIAVKLTQAIRVSNIIRIVMYFFSDLDTCFIILTT